MQDLFRKKGHKNTAGHVPSLVMSQHTLGPLSNCAAHDEDCSSARILINGKPVAFKLDTWASSQCQPQQQMFTDHVPNLLTSQHRLDVPLNNTEHLGCRHSAHDEGTARLCKSSSMASQLHSSSIREHQSRHQPQKILCWSCSTHESAQTLMFHQTTLNTLTAGTPPLWFSLLF